MSTASKNQSTKTDVNTRNLFIDEEISRHYTQTRPNYTEEFYQEVIDFCEQKNTDLHLAVDVGCGPGCSTVGLCKFFQKVIGVDISETQIAGAPKDIPNCEFRVGDATDLSFLKDNSVDLFCAGLSLNLMPVKRVLAEADRVLKPGGTLTLFGYNLPEVEDERMNELFQEAYLMLKPQVVDAGEITSLLNKYEDVDIPYPNIIRKDGVILERQISYDDCKTFWPALQRMLHAVGKDTEGTLLKHMLNRTASTFPELEKNQSGPLFNMLYKTFLVMAHKPC